VKVLRAQAGAVLGAGQERHAPSLGWHVDQRDPGRQRQPVAGVRPVRAVLVELGGDVVVRLLDQQLIVPEPQREAGQLLGDPAESRVERERAEAVVALPDVDQLAEGAPLLQALGAMGGQERLGAGPEALDLMLIERTAHSDETVFPVRGNELAGHPTVVVDIADCHVASVVGG
jgi:hypothetical protein